MESIASSFLGSLELAGYRCVVEDLRVAVKQSLSPYALLLSSADADTLGTLRLLRRKQPGILGVLCAGTVEEATVATASVDAVVAQSRLGDEIVRVLEECHDLRGRRHREALSVARALVRGLSIRQVETREHQERLAAWGKLLANAIGDAQLAEQVELGAIVHDIGMIGVPDAVLTKQGTLSAEEWVLVRKHPEYGAKQLKDLDLLRSAVPLVLSHHERWDGTGYPKGLRRKTIPLVARVFAVCDAFEAMTADRPYRKAAAVAEAQEKIANERGKAFDPEVVDAFMTLDTSELLIAGSQRASLWPSLT